MSHDMMRNFETVRRWMRKGLRVGRELQRQLEAGDRKRMSTTSEGAIATKNNEADGLSFQHSNAATASAALVKRQLILEPTVCHVRSHPPYPFFKLKRQWQHARSLFICVSGLGWMDLCKELECDVSM